MRLIFEQSNISNILKKLIIRTCESKNSKGFYVICVKILTDSTKTLD